MISPPGSLDLVQTVHMKIWYPDGLSHWMFSGKLTIS